MEDGLDIEIQFKTVHSEGVLLLAGKEGEMFLASYIEDGILHFKGRTCYSYLPVLGLRYWRDFLKIDCKNIKNNF